MPSLCYKLTIVQSIRRQQVEKRNLAEYAFTLAKRQEDWVEVGAGILYQYLG